MTRLIGVSLKTYMDPRRTRLYVESVLSAVAAAGLAGIDFFIVPDMVSLGSVAPVVTEYRHAMLAAQDCYWEDSGAFTGTISPKNLAQIGVRMVEIGHAERRRYFGESDADIARKAEAVVRNGMIPLLCIGEETHGTVEEAIEACMKQLHAVTSVIGDSSEIVVAYEPVWAIGKAEPAEPAYVRAVTSAIKEDLDTRNARGRVLYGGSAGPGLYAKLHPAVDGLFLGRFGHDTAKVLQVVNEIAGVENGS